MQSVIGDRIHLSDDMLIALRRERAVLTAFPDGVPPNEHLARVLMREDRIAQVCVCVCLCVCGTCLVREALCIYFSFRVS
jgi:hypothetical protein